MVHGGSLHDLHVLLSLEALVQYLLDTGFMTSARDAIAPAIARQVPVITANHKNCMMRKNGLSTCVCMCVVVFFSVLVGCTVDECMLANKVTTYMMVFQKKPLRGWGAIWRYLSRFVLVHLTVDG